ncbi:MAG: adenylate/guanylate cyclase domain-containing protein [Cyanobacteria bacterium P01_H01_bin.119]
MGLGLLSVQAWEPLERLAYNALFQTRARLIPPDWDERIVVVAIDEASLNRYGRFPWPRDRYGVLLDTLLAAQPAAIGFDLIFAESGPYDERFAESIAISGNVVLAVGDDGAGSALEISPTLTDPAEGTFLLGHVKHTADTDGISRRVWLYEGRFPILGVALLQMYNLSLNQTLGEIASEPPQIDPAVLAQPEQFSRQSTWLNWPGPIQTESNYSNALKVLSFSDVLEGQVPPEQLQNKIVLVGITAAALDPLRTPFHTSVPTAGVYLHAAVVDNLLQDRLLQRWPAKNTAVVLLLVALATSFILKPLTFKGRVLMLVGLVSAWLAIAYGSFTQQVWLPVAAPIGTCLLSGLGLQFIEQRERQSLMNLLALNISPEMANLMWQQKTDILDKGQIQPQELTATVLFTDIRGFTTITEGLPSQALLPWLNRYFEVMTDCIMAHGGIVDKYIGDAIMAVFGAPVPHTSNEEIQQDAIAAVKAGLGMYKALQTLNKEFAAAGLPTIRFGVGIHTGTVIGGTVGSRRRINYSLFGDAVNVAARLQDMTKAVTVNAPYPILLSEATYHHVSELYQGQAMGELMLRGRVSSMPVYSIE